MLKDAEKRLRDARLTPVQWDAVLGAVEAIQREAESRERLPGAVIWTRLDAVRMAGDLAEV